MQVSRSSQRLNLGRQAALGAQSLVLVDDPLVGNAVEDGNGLLEEALSGGFVAGFDGLEHALAVRRKCPYQWRFTSCNDRLKDFKSCAAKNWFRPTTWIGVIFFPCT